MLIKEDVDQLEAPKIGIRRPLLFEFESSNFVPVLHSLCESCHDAGWHIIGVAQPPYWDPGSISCVAWSPLDMVGVMHLGWTKF